MLGTWSPNCPSPMNIIKCKTRCTSTVAPNFSSSRERDEKQTGSREKNLAPLYPPLCVLSMLALKPTEVEVEVIELAQWGLFCGLGLRKSRLVTHLWVCLLTPGTVVPHLGLLMSCEDMARWHTRNTFAWWKPLSFLVRPLGAYLFHHGS